MTTIILPDHKLIRHPEVIARPRVRQIYADGGMVCDYLDIVRLIFYVEDEPGRAHQNLCVFMSRTGFDRSLIVAASQFLPGLAAGGLH